MSRSCLQPTSLSSLSPELSEAAPLMGLPQPPPLHGHPKLSLLGDWSPPLISVQESLAQSRLQPMLSRNVLKTHT